MTHPSSSDIDDPMLELQQEYIREAPARLAELRKDLLAFRAVDSGDGPDRCRW